MNETSIWMVKYVWWCGHHVCLGCFLDVSHGGLSGGFHDIGCRLGSLDQLPGVGHSGLFRVLHDQPGSGLCIKWERSLNMTPSDDTVPSKSQTFLLCIRSGLSCLQHGRSAGCTASLAVFNFRPPCVTFASFHLFQPCQLAMRFACSYRIEAAALESNIYPKGEPHHNQHTGARIHSCAACGQSTGNTYSAEGILVWRTSPLRPVGRRVQSEMHLWHLSAPVTL